MTSSKENIDSLKDRAKPANSAESVFKLIPCLWILGGALTFWRFGYTAMRGSDLWLHIATGRLIVENGWIPTVDPWAFTTAGYRWVVDAWLSDFIFFGWSQLFGMQALAWWKWLMVIAIFLLLMRMLWRVAKEPIAAYMAAFLAAAVAAPFIDIRPHLYSLLCFVILIDLTLKRERPHWAVVPLFFVWVNLHAGFSLGCIMLPILMLPYLMRQEERTRTILIIAGCLAACMINPNGYHALTQPVIYALGSDTPFLSIGEWQSPFKARGIQSPLYPYAIGIWVCSAIFLVAANIKEKSVPWVQILIGILALAMSLKSRRFITVFAISQALVLAPCLTLLLQGLKQKIPSFAPPVAAVLIGVFLLYPYPQKSYAFYYLTAGYTFPVETVNFIAVNGLSGKVFSYYNWGGYLHLRTNGRMSVYIDGRASAVFDEQTYRNYTAVRWGHSKWADIIDASGAAYFLWPRTSIKQAAALVKTGRWRVLYQDVNSILLVRTDHEMDGKLILTPHSPFREVQRGFVAYSQKNYAPAQKHFQQAIDMMPYNRNAHAYLARAQALDGRKTEARKTIRKSSELFPDKSFAEYLNKSLRLE